MVSVETSEQKIMQHLENVADPEIPVISIVDLGIVRRVEVRDDGKIYIDLSPTYSGCPALDVIPILVKEELAEHDITEVEIKNVISPPWTTDWISESGLKKLNAFGIAPPHRSNDPEMNKPVEERIVACPQCGSTDTKMVSRFGSTPCKSAFQCESCLEPFDYFKCH